jgi:hypothetical protein
LSDQAPSWSRSNVSSSGLFVWLQLTEESEDETFDLDQEGA